MSTPAIRALLSKVVLLAPARDTLRMWSNNNVRVLANVQGAHRAVFSPSGRRVALRSYADIVLLDLNSPVSASAAISVSAPAATTVATSLFTRRYTAVMCFVSETMLACGDTNGMISLLDTTTGGIVDSIEPSIGSVLCLERMPVSKRIVAATTRGELAVINTSKALSVQHVLPGATSRYPSVAVTRNERFIITGSDDSIIKVIDSMTGKVVTTINGPASVSSLRMHSSGAVFAAAHEFGHITLWETTTWAVIGHSQLPFDTINATIVFAEPSIFNVIISHRERGAVLIDLQEQTHEALGLPTSGIANNLAIQPFPSWTQTLL